MHDRDGLPLFLGTLFRIDVDQRLERTFEQHRALVLAIFGDEFLARFFWDDPGEDRARSYQRATARAEIWLNGGQYRLVMDHLLERVHLLRDQLVNGAATSGGRLNRAALARCAELMDALLPAIATVIIDHGTGEDWGVLCYPPQHSTTEAT